MARGKAFKFNNAQLRKYTARIQRENDKAVAATLNELSKVGIRATAQQLQEETGVKQAAVRRRITVTKATVFNHVFMWFIRGRRLSWIQPRTLKGGPKKRGGNRIGVSFLADNKRRTRATENINQGSKPFLAKLNVVKDPDTGAVKSKGNKLAVYRGKTKTKESGLIKLVGHSLPWLLNEDWLGRIKAGLIILMPAEYRKQLKKAKFRR